MSIRIGLGMGTGLCLYASTLVQAWQSIPAEAVKWPELCQDHVTAYRCEHSVFLEIESEVVASGELLIPRLAAPIRTVRWIGETARDALVPVTINPTPEAWLVKWPLTDSVSGVIEIELEHDPNLQDGKTPLPPSGDGSFMLHAWQARTVGRSIRYEPQPHKNTIGYWTELDGQAAWTIQVDEPGAFAVAVLQGCGAGQGGSEARLSIAGDGVEVADLTFATVDTGHFQNFRWIHLGVIEIASQGKHEVQVEALRISKNALCDLRAIHLVRQASVQATR